MLASFELYFSHTCYRVGMSAIYSGILQKNTVKKRQKAKRDFCLIFNYVPRTPAATPNHFPSLQTRRHQIKEFLKIVLKFLDFISFHRSSSQVNHGSTNAIISDYFRIRSIKSEDNFNTNECKYQKYLTISVNVLLCVRFFNEGTPKLIGI